MMEYRNGFFDQNSERYMMEKRVETLMKALHERYSYDAVVPTGVFEKAEGNVAHAQLAALSWASFDAQQEVWGKPDGNAWFRQCVTIPAEMDGKPVVYAAGNQGTANWYWGGPQILVYVNGIPVSGMDTNHREVLLTECAKAGESYVIELSVFFDNLNYEGRVGLNMRLAAINAGVRALFYDLSAPFGASINLSEEDTRRLDILQYLNAAVSLVDFRLPSGDAFDRSVDAARSFMREEFYCKYCKHDGVEDVLVTAVGHTHIDSGYLWGFEITRKKVCRSYATVLQLMKQYPNYTFFASQPQLYQFLKDELPEVYGQVKQRIAEGRWEADGGMWIESDTNMPSGESLVRQFLYGKQFFSEEFGSDSRVLWLPDAFGFSGALPQILKKCGIDYFMTTKLGSNEFNKFPFDTFTWRGIDGSEVLTHFVCGVDTKEDDPRDFFTSYNAHITANYMVGSWKRYQQKDLNRNILFTYGHGDGGGGPTFAMLEYASRIQEGIPGCPKVELGHVRNYFKKLDHDVSNNKRLPVWDGELYFQNHRGTYTSVARMKKNNRKGEVLLQDAELFSIMRQVAGDDAAYPKDGLAAAWRLLLLNQFHDILTGASIKAVYDENEGHFDTLRGVCSDALDGAFEAIASRVDLDRDALVVFNSTAFARDDLVTFTTDRDDFAILDGGVSLPWQKTAEGEVIFLARGIPAKGYKAFAFGAAAAQPTRAVAVVQGQTVETDEFKVVFDENGNISSLFSKGMNRDIVQSSEAMNRLITFEEVGADAWNIKPFFEEKTWFIDELDAFEIVENGPVRCVVRLSRHFMDSLICQEFIFARGVDRIDVKNRIDWKNNQLLLKADFPFAINASRASFDIQFGHLERTTSENTSWEFAQFEVCAHRWADLSEDAFGLSILNDCKYGYDVKKGHIRLSLLRSSIMPDPTADIGQHEFTYAIYPHAGTWKQAETVKQAAFLNCRTYAREEKAHGGSLPETFSLVSCPAENVIIDTVKQSEDGKNIVLRVYENHNRTTDTVLTFAKPVKAAWLCNMLEENQGQAALENGGIALHIKPFEVQTLRIELEAV